MRVKTCQMSSEEATKSNFIHDFIDEDLKNGTYQQVMTRFPPEPNGFLHIGHVKAIGINFSTALKYKGKCNLRFDDTNPVKEDDRYVTAIQEDIKWLGYDWEDRLYFASDYFPQLYQYAIELIKAGKAYVESLSAQEMREYRGTLKEAGKNSPYRDRTIEENLKLFEGMKNGEFEDGAHILRAKIDMSSPNINMRDPALYRIRKAHHHRTGDEWCIYPMYDFAHGLSDAIEGVSHSLCSLEFEAHRPLYDWFLDNLDVPSRPRQIEFARLFLNYTVMSKRKFIRMIDEGAVDGWDDPRMPTLRGLRRRGYTPASIHDFLNRIGVAKANSLVDIALLEHCLRDDLNKHAQRVMAVLDPLKVVITNFPEGEVVFLDAENNPENPDDGKRQIPFSRNLYIEREDFMEDAPRKYYRLTQDKEVRFKNAYYITCNEVIKDENGEITELRCTYDPATKGGWSDDGRKVKGTLHWVSIDHAVDAEVRVYDRLFSEPSPDTAEDFMQCLNANSLTTIKNCKVEPALKDAVVGTSYQFLRKGYYCVDNKDSTPEHLVFNQTVSLRDSWGKIQQKNKKK